MNVVNESEDVAGVGYREPAEGEVEKEIEHKGNHVSSSEDPSHLKTVLVVFGLFNWNGRQRTSNMHTVVHQK